MSQYQENTKQALATPDTIQLSTEERIKFIANLIVDRIIQDEKDNFALLEKIDAEYDTIA
ncbi:hypothetical protein CVV43_04085 [Candidatus Saccharibacteria bacterium HGW-Saccharibacteria-1]|jgi:hypothetical protein|nr:MAG: hypothetical protein CVV43_04085 [Candidatus Saccharibacteria bacterium HGW-Saccharibacteria-1]